MTTEKTFGLPSYVEEKYPRLEPKQGLISKLPGLLGKSLVGGTLFCAALGVGGLGTVYFSEIGGQPYERVEQTFSGLFEKLPFATLPYKGGLLLGKKIFYTDLKEAPLVTYPFREEGKL